MTCYHALDSILFLEKKYLDICVKYMCVKRAQTEYKECPSFIKKNKKMDTFFMYLTFDNI